MVDGSVLSYDLDKSRTVLACCSMEHRLKNDNAIFTDFQTKPRVKALELD